MSELFRLLNEIAADRESGTEDAWWRTRIADYALDEEYGVDETVNGGQDAADRRRIMRAPKVERALTETVRQRDNIAKRLAAARDAWEAFKGATVSDAHFDAVARLDAALSLPPEQTPPEP